MEKKILDKLKELKVEFDSISNKLEDPKIISDIKQFTDLNKKLKHLEPKILLYNEFLFFQKEIVDAESLLNEKVDDETLELLKETLQSAKKELEESEKKILKLMIEQDPYDEKDVIMEIKSAAGGDEAKIFVGDLYRMYLKFAIKKAFKVEIIDQEESDSDGFSSIALMIKGKDAYKWFKFESGVHRVQRIPQTETQGRIHTSTATVSVMPKLEDEDIKINLNDLKINTYKSSGAGGQHVNKTDSAVRITHIPTGIVVQSQEGKSQHKNKEKAFSILRAKLYEEKQKKEQKSFSEQKKKLIGTGDRSEKIRTYNFPQNRVTDHRINLTIKKLDKIINGELEEIIDVLNSLQKGDFNGE